MLQFPTPGIQAANAGTRKLSVEARLLRRATATRTLKQLCLSWNFFDPRSSLGSTAQCNFRRASFQDGSRPNAPAMTAFEKELRQEFEAVVTDQLDALYRTALRLQGNPSDAEDAVQECCARAFRGLSGFKRDSSMRVWLFRILKNICIDKLRWRSRLRLVSSDAENFSVENDAPHPGDTPEEACVRSSVSRLVDQAIQALPIEQRAVVALVLVEEFTYAEAAEALQVPVGTVRSRLNRARTQLRRVISTTESAERPAETPDTPLPGKLLVV